ncbi:MAG: hypothetical protein IKE56_09835 [Lachnospiraceae bacterium]|nr:hypothetical protein [Lachnospiraceae bacterium]
MKRLFNIVLAGMAAMLLFGCTPSDIKASQSVEIPAGAILETGTRETWTMPETSQYTIPADAETGEKGGPGAMQTTEVDYSYYPSDKQPVVADDETATTQVIIYKAVLGGIDQDFDAVEECNAQSLIDAMIRNGAIKEGCEVISFDVENKAGKLELSSLKGVFYKATEDEVVASVVNTFIDNFDLDTLKLIVGDKDYGEMGFTSDYDV